MPTVPGEGGQSPLLPGTVGPDAREGATGGRIVVEGSPLASVSLANVALLV